MNALRGHLAEFGMIAAQGPQHVPKLIALVDDLASELPTMARQTLAVLVDNLRGLDSRVRRRLLIIGASTAARWARSGRIEAGILLP
jgi:hypothetical protein